MRNETAALRRAIASGDVKVSEWTVDPTRSAVSLALTGAPKGYVFWKMEREGTKAKVYYVREA